MILKAQFIKAAMRTAAGVAGGALLMAMPVGHANAAGGTYNSGEATVTVDDKTCTIEVNNTHDKLVVSSAFTSVFFRGGDRLVEIDGAVVTDLTTSGKLPALNGYEKAGLQVAAADAKNICQAHFGFKPMRKP